ncbi:MAG: hypothetical protein AAFU67_14550, partial [Bacteroidota bacterium]
MTTVSLIRYQKFTSQWWAFTQMGLAPRHLAQTEGLQFGRLMGSGGNDGFSIRPNFKVYAWLACWENKQAADTFFTHHAWWQKAKSRSVEQITFFLQPTMAHGKWEGQNPFGKPTTYDPRQPTAVLTRATIRTRKLPEFWRWVPKTSASIHDHPARLMSIGIGEYPIFMQATFSLWESGKAMQEFAYHSKYHKEVVRLTRERKW